MGEHKVAPITGWYEAVSQLEAWEIFCTVFLGDYGVQPATYEMFLLLEETSRVSPRLKVKARQQPTFPAALICLIKYELNKSSRQVLDRRQRVQWPNFKSLRRALATVNLRPKLVALPGGLAPPEHPFPPPVAPRRQESATTLPVAGTTPMTQAQSRRNQAQEHNPHPCAPPRRSQSESETLTLSAYV